MCFMTYGMFVTIKIMFKGLLEICNFVITLWNCITISWLRTDFLYIYQIDLNNQLLCCKNMIINIKLIQCKYTTIHLLCYKLDVGN